MQTKKIEKTEHVENTIAVTTERRKVRSPNLINNLPSYNLPGIHVCWVNDDNDPTHYSGSNVGNYLDCGYSFIMKKKNDKLEETFSLIEGDQRGTPSSGHLISRVVNRRGLVAYLMGIPENAYEEMLKIDAQAAKDLADKARRPSQLDNEYGYGFEFKQTYE